MPIKVNIKILAADEQLYAVATCDDCEGVLNKSVFNPLISSTVAFLREFLTYFSMQPKPECKT
jgi:hypothetical protein